MRRPHDLVQNLRHSVRPDTGPEVRARARLSAFAKARASAMDGDVSESGFSPAMVEHVRTMVGLHSEQAALEEIARQITATLMDGGKILLCADAGSAASAQYMAGELAGRFQKTCSGAAAVALTAALPATPNWDAWMTDCGGDGSGEVLRRQVESLARPGDLLIAFSIAGDCGDVCAAAAASRRLGVYTVAMCGEDGGRLAELADTVVRVGSETATRVREAHLFCGHVLCTSAEMLMQQAARDRRQGPNPESIQSQVHSMPREQAADNERQVRGFSVFERRRDRAGEGALPAPGVGVGPTRAGKVEQPSCQPFWKRNAIQQTRHVAEFEADGEA